MKTFLEFKKYLVEDKKQVNDLLLSEQPKDIALVSTKRLEIFEGFNHFLLNCIGSFSHEEYLNKLNEFLVSNKFSDSAKRSSLIGAGFQFASPNEDNYYDLNDLHNLDNNKFISFIKESYNKLPEKNKDVSRKKFILSFTNQNKYINHFEGSFIDDCIKFAKTLVPEDDFNKYVPSDEIYVDPELMDVNEIDIPVLENEIEEFLNDDRFSNDLEVNQALNEAKDIMVVGNGKVTQRHYAFVRYYSNFVGGEQSYETVNFLNNKYGGNFVFQSNHIEYLNDSEKLASERFVNAPSLLFQKPEGNKEFVFFSEEEKNNIIELYNLMDQHDFLQGNFGEQEEKAYSFTNLLINKNKIKQAILNKDKELLISSVKKYKDAENCLDDLLTKIDSYRDYDSGFMDNLDVARNQDVPYKYRHNYESASILNGCYILFGIVKSMGLRIDDVLDNPNILVPQFINKGIDENVFDQCVQNMNKHDFIQGLFGGSNSYRDEIDSAVKMMKAGTTAPYLQIYGIDRAISSLMYLTANKETQNNIAAFAQICSMGMSASEFNSKLVKNVKKFLSFKNMDIEQKADKIANILAIEPKDFNYHSMIPDCEEITYDLYEKTFQHFNRNDYLLEKDNPSDQVYCGIKFLLQLQESGNGIIRGDNKKAFSKAIVKNLQAFPESKLSKTVQEFKSMVDRDGFERYSNQELLTLKLERQINPVFYKKDLSFRSTAIAISKVLAFTDVLNSDVNEPIPDLNVAFTKDNQNEYIKVNSNPAKQLLNGITAYNLYMDSRNFDSYSSKEIKEQKNAFQLAIISNINAFEANEQSKLVERYKEKVALGKIDSLSQYDFNNIKFESEFYVATHKPQTVETRIEALKVYAKAKKEYEERSFFAKLFFSSAKNTKLLIDGMHNQLINSGINEQLIQNSLQNLQVNNEQLEADLSAVNEPNLELGNDNLARSSIVLDLLDDQPNQHIAQNKQNLNLNKNLEKNNNHLEMK